MRKPYIIADTNRKGGVGKTTSTLNLCAAFAKLGQRVLGVDLDCQGMFSYRLGFEADGKPTIGEAIMYAANGLAFDNATIRHSEAEGFDYIPAVKTLAAITGVLETTEEKLLVLRKLFSASVFQDYDYIFMDCPPSLDLLVLNAFAASDGILLALSAQKDAYQMALETLDMVRRIQSSANPALQIYGILLTMYRKQTKMSKDIDAILHQEFSECAINTKISFLTEADKSMEAGISMVNLPSSQCGKEYLAAAKELVERRANRDRSA